MPPVSLRRTDRSQLKCGGTTVDPWQVLVNAVVSGLISGGLVTFLGKPFLDARLARLQQSYRVEADRQVERLKSELGSEAAASQLRYARRVAALENLTALVDRAWLAVIAFASTPSVQEQSKSLQAITECQEYVRDRRVWIPDALVRNIGELMGKLLEAYGMIVPLSPRSSEAGGGTDVLRILGGQLPPLMEAMRRSVQAWLESPLTVPPESNVEG